MCCQREKINLPFKQGDIIFGSTVAGLKVRYTLETSTHEHLINFFHTGAKLSLLTAAGIKCCQVLPIFGTHFNFLNCKQHE